ncbi:MAG: hypothetical protein IKO65_07955 [Victivallales bacterium]|nr:hypothetical protein [Victivallales bacterium]
MNSISIDFTASQGKIKPLHGVNDCPVSLDSPPKGFAEAGIPYCRLHDTAGAFGGTHYVDIPNVFPDFDADPANPASYDFAFTDALLKQIHAAGTEPFYRLGVTIENNWRIKAYHIFPPKDFAKWAEICAGIVRHYNEGWADGMRLGIAYWEIWNEPENPPMWQGTQEQYFELYRITARRLKREFPSIKVGGYASCGFYAVTRPGMSDFFQSFLTWYDAFLDYVCASETSAPLDFFSWHLYTDDPEEIALHAKYAQDRLSAHGLTQTENIFNEWNYASGEGDQRWVNMKEADGAAFVASAFCLMQESPIDKAMYYVATPSGCYCGLYYFPSMDLTPTYYAFRAWQELFRLGRQCPVSGDELPPKCYATAATDGTDTAVLLVNNGDDTQELSLNTTGPALSHARLTDCTHKFATLPLQPTTSLPPKGVLLLTSQPVEDVEPEVQPQRIIHAGLDG